jgi:hypothetical protein
MIQEVCSWCSGPFTPRTTGGRPQRFCSERCRRASEKAMREWAQAELAAGRVTLAELPRRPILPAVAPAPAEALRPSAAIVCDARTTQSRQRR